METWQSWQMANVLYILMGIYIASIAMTKKRAKEKLYGKKDDKKVEESGKTVTFGTANANGEEDIKPSLDSQSFTFNRDGGKKRPQTLKEAFDLPESDEEKARDIQERFGYILDTPTTANDIRGARLTAEGPSRAVAGLASPNRPNLSLWSNSSLPRGGSVSLPFAVRPLPTASSAILAAILPRGIPLRRLAPVSRRIRMRETNPCRIDDVKNRLGILVLRQLHAHNELVAVRIGRQLVQQRSQKIFRLRSQFLIEEVVAVHKRGPVWIPDISTQGSHPK